MSGSEQSPQPKDGPQNDADPDSSSKPRLPAPRGEGGGTVRLPLIDEVLPQVLINAVAWWPERRRPMVVTVLECEPGPESDAGSEHEFGANPSWGRVLLRAEDHLIFVHSEEQARQFRKQLRDPQVALGRATVSSSPVELACLARAYESTRLTLRLITGGLASPGIPVQTKPPSDTDVEFYVSPASLLELRKLLDGLACEPISQRLRLARTLSQSLTGQETHQQLARSLGVSAATVRNHLNRLHTLLGSKPSEPRATVLLLAVLPRLIHLWEEEARMSR